MNDQPTLLKRLSIGKTIGLVIGIGMFFMLPLADPAIDVLFCWGFMFWLTLTGGFIGLSGGIDKLPVFNFTLSWWFRGTALGGIMFLMLWFVAYEKIDAIVVNVVGADSMFLNGPWIVVDGLAYGFIVAALIKLFGVEGNRSLVQDQ